MDYKQLIIEHAKKAEVGHIGSALSVADILYVLYTQILEISNTDFNQRDRFILSKGHAGLALYVILFMKGFISKSELDSYCQNGSKFGVHPQQAINGVDFATGSLGMGVTYATGCALSSKIENSSRLIYCLLSDAELNCGSFWETILFVSHQKLSNLIFILDNNGQQALGYTKDILNLENIEKKMKEFGFDTYNIDGHNLSAIENCFNEIKLNHKKNIAKKPFFVVANTKSGKDVSFMEGTIEWHYKSMNNQQYAQALIELNEK